MIREGKAVALGSSGPVLGMLAVDSVAGDRV